MTRLLTTSLMGLVALLFLSAPVIAQDRDRDRDRERARERYRGQAPRDSNAGDTRIEYLLKNTQFASSYKAHTDDSGKTLYNVSGRKSEVIVQYTVQSGIPEIWIWIDVAGYRDGAQPIVYKKVARMSDGDVCPGSLSMDQNDIVFLNYFLPFDCTTAEVLDRYLVVALKTASDLQYEF